MSRATRRWSGEPAFNPEVLVSPSCDERTRASKAGLKARPQSNNQAPAHAQARLAVDSDIPSASVASGMFIPAK